MAKRPCTRPGCPNLVDRGCCEACKPRSQASITERRRGSSTARGYNYRWQKESALYLSEHPICVDPGGRHVGIPRAATQTDHIVPHRGDQVLFWLKRNWQGLCDGCHAYKTAREDGGFGR
jgi:5-methylcytosine-specific restriction protein A